MKRQTYIRPLTKVYQIHHLPLLDYQSLEDGGDDGGDGYAEAAMMLMIMADEEEDDDAMFKF